MPFCELVKITGVKIIRSNNGPSPEQCKIAYEFKTAEGQWGEFRKDHRLAYNEHGQFVNTNYQYINRQEIRYVKGGDFLRIRGIETERPNFFWNRGQGIKIALKNTKMLYSVGRHEKPILPPHKYNIVAHLERNLFRLGIKKKGVGKNIFYGTLNNEYIPESKRRTSDVLLKHYVSALDGWFEFYDVEAQHYRTANYNRLEDFAVTYEAKRDELRQKINNGNQNHGV